MKSFFSNIGFTKNETRVVLLIIAVLIIGAGIKYYKYLFTDDKAQYNYSKSDSEFRKLSEDARKKEFDAVNNDSLKNEDYARLSAEMKLEQDSIEAIEKDPRISKKELKLREKSINLNTAGADELVSLPGVGQGIAEKILEFRNKNGKFKKIQDLMKVKGIGEKKFEKIKEYLTIE